MLTTYLVTLVLILAPMAKGDMEPISIPYCTSKVVKIYKLSDPGFCKQDDNSTAVITPVTILKPFNKRVNLAATACRKVVSTYSCIYFFFGSKSCNLVKTNYLMVSKSECLSAATSHLTTLGPLILMENNFLTTQNILIPSYAWPKEKLVDVANFVMINTNIIKDISTNTFEHINIDNLVCNIEHKSCTANYWRINYYENKIQTCANVSKIENTSLTIHTTSRGSMYVNKDANIITTSLHTCDQIDLKCTPNNDAAQYLCTPSGHVLIIPKNITILKKNKTHNNLPSTLKNLQSAITTVSHGNLLNTQLLKKYIEYSSCVNSRSNMIALMGTQRLNPSVVLSHILGEEVQAVFSRGTLKQLSCTNVQAVLKNSLIYKSGHVSNSPLFSVYMGDEIILSSLKQNRFISKHISNTVTNIQKKSFLFRNKLLTYINNSLIKYNRNIHKLSLKHLSINDTFLDIDEDEFDLELKTSFSSEEENTQQQLKNLIELTKLDWKRKGIDINNWLTNTHTINRLNLNGALINLEQSLWAKTKNILNSITYIYTIIFTFVFIVLFIQTLRHLLHSKETYVVNA